MAALLIVNQQHLEAVLREHHNAERPHRSRNLRPPPALRSLGKSRGGFASAAYSATIVERQTRRDLLFEPHTPLRGTYRGVSDRQMQAYIDEFVFRFNRRRTPMAAFHTLLGIGTRAVAAHGLG